MQAVFDSIDGPVGNVAAIAEIGLMGANFTGPDVDNAAAVAEVDLG